MTTPLRIVFMGTPEFAVPSLRALLEADPEKIGRVVGVVTQPDRPKGRGQQLTPSPVKVLAQQAGLPILQPLKMKDPAFLETLKSWVPDLIAVTAFGRILPPVILDLPPKGCVNVHGSLLPKYRGAAPIQWAIINGETETGITTMLMDPGMDTGPVLLQEPVPILPMETAGELAARLAPIGGRLLVKTISGLKDGTLTPNPQDHSRATLAPLLKKEDGMLRWDEEATALANRIRGLTPWPGAYTYHGDERWQIWRAEPANPGCAVAEPGVILEVTKETIRVAAGKGALLIYELQPASGKRLSVKQYLAGHPVKTGSRLGPGPCDPSPDAL
ncbi:MAG: methionyl-tRNA formyltransferase [Nitrospirae bacterium]|nr:MAG: methionyl-tRNA formyltransferase [Nitrospirota bacterium]